jgi:hypothetical protein
MTRNWSERVIMNSYDHAIKELRSMQERLRALRD